MRRLSCLILVSMVAVASGLIASTDAKSTNVEDSGTFDELDLSGVQTTDADVARRLERTTSLQVLNLDRTSITDIGLVHLRGLSSLRSLSLRYTKITAAGLAHLKDLVSLEILRLENTQVSDEGLIYLKDLISLKTLFLGNTQVTDKGLVQVQDLTTLRRFCVHQTQITDAGLSYLKGLTGLKYLCVHDTRVADTGMEYLKGMTGLETLYLHNTRVTDDGLVYLKSLSSLRKLTLTGTRVTEKGVSELKKALPKCNISGVSPSKQRSDIRKTTGQTRPKPSVGTRISIPPSKGNISTSYRQRSPRRFSEKTHIWPVEMLRRIPGPIFLLVFIGLSGACIGIVWLWINADGTGSYPLPELTRFDPFAVAALRGGSPAVIRAAVFSLWNQKLVEIEKQHHWWKKDEFEIKSVPSQQRVLSPVEEEIYQYLQTLRDPRDLFNDASLKYRIEQLLEPVHRELEELHLSCTDAQKSRVWIVVIVIASVIAIVGGTKLYLGHTYDKPSGFLVLLLVGSLVSLILIIKCWRLATLTQLGRRYLKALEEHFAWLKEPANLDKNPEGIDSTLSIAVFGIGVLAGASMYEAFTEAFPLNKAGSFVGGCGGGCGGGGCGGGCGGCGGCGGG